jgi:hypothetical protein
MRRHGAKSDKSCINSCERDEETRTKKHKRWREEDGESEGERDDKS